MSALPTATFGHSDPSWRVGLALPETFVTPDFVATGDIVFTRRPNGYQRLAAVAGDTWRHVGVIAMVAGHPWMLEMGPHGYQARPLSTVVDMYDTVAIQRLTPCRNRCDHQLLSHIALQMDSPRDFHTRIELGTIGLCSLFRLRVFRTRRPFQRATKLLRSLLDGRHGFEDRGICSTPLATSLEMVCDAHQVQLDVLGEKERGPDPELRGTGPVNLAMPDDIWRALQSSTDSFWIKHDDRLATPVLELPTAQLARRQSHPPSQSQSRQAREEVPA